VVLAGLPGAAATMRDLLAAALCEVHDGGCLLSRTDGPGGGGGGGALALASTPLLHHEGTFSAKLRQ